MELVKRAAIAIAGTVLTLAWWSFRGSDDHTEQVTTVPEVVWEGGTAVTIEASCSEVGKLHLSFGRRGPQGEEGPDQQLEVNVELQPGDHTYTISVPDHVHGYVELGIDKPPVGAKASVHVRVGEEVAAEDEAELDSPLKEGYAFAAQVHMQDYAAGEAD